MLAGDRLYRSDPLTVFIDGNNLQVAISNQFCKHLQMGGLKQAMRPSAQAAGVAHCWEHSWEAINFAKHDKHNKQNEKTCPFSTALRTAPQAMDRAMGLAPFLIFLPLCAGLRRTLRRTPRSFRSTAQPSAAGRSGEDLPSCGSGRFKCRRFAAAISTPGPPKRRGPGRWQWLVLANQW